MKTALALPDPFVVKIPVQMQDELRGLPAPCIEAILRYEASGGFDAVVAMLPGLIEFHQPRRATHPPEELTDTLRLKQDLGLDSLALTELAFRLEDLLGITIETRDVFHVETVGDLKAFLKSRLPAA